MNSTTPTDTTTDNAGDNANAAASTAPAGTDNTATAGNAADTGNNSTTATDAGAGEGKGETAGKTGATGNDAAAQPPAGSKPEEGEPDQPLSARAPESYTVPEGYQLDAPQLEFITGVSRESGLSQEQFEAGLKHWHELRQREHEFERGQWRLDAEKQFGNDFAGIADGAKRALVFAEKERPGITERMDGTNLGNHPDVLWLFNKLGQLSKSDAIQGVESPAGGTVQPKTIAERMYPSASSQT